MIGASRAIPKGVPSGGGAHVGGGDAAERSYIVGPIAVGKPRHHSDAERKKKGVGSEGITGQQR